MANKIAQDAAKVMEAMFKRGEFDPKLRDGWFSGRDLCDFTGLSFAEVNDAVDYLDDRHFLTRMNYKGTAPFHFGEINLTSRGRYAYHEMTSASPPNQPAMQPDASAALENAPLLPVGSPFGFTDLDWEFVQRRKRQRTVLFVVMGFQFSSQHYDTEGLRSNVEDSFRKALNSYNQRGGRENVTLDFKPLAAGYGEHLFNQIARDIISADIAVFETSDLNPNVMIEMGVALTWGSRVLPIKKVGCPKPPSDISGQTWADYSDNASNFVNPNHEEDLVAMIERAIQKKAV